MTRSEDLFRQEKDRELKRIPYSHFVNEKVIATKDKSLMVFFELEGKPIELLMDDELDHGVIQRHNFLSSIADERIKLYTYLDHSRTKVPTKAPKNIVNAVANEIYEGNSKRGVYKNRQFLVLELSIYNKSEKTAAGLFSLFGFNRAMFNYAERRKRAVDEIQTLANRILTFFSEYGARQLTTYKHEGVSCSQQLEFLHRVLNGFWQRVAVPDMDISAYLSSGRKRFAAGQFELRQPNKNVIGRALNVKAYPQGTNYKFLEEIYSIPGNLLIAQGFEFIHSNDIVKRINDQIAKMSDSYDESDSQIEDMRDAKDDVIAGKLAFGEHYFTIAIYGKTNEELNLIQEKVFAALSKQGAIGIVEDTGTEPAYWSMLPGNLEYAPRLRPISTKNFACSATFSGEYLGANKSVWGSPVAYFPTAKGSIYKFNWHLPETDKGHSIVVGPNGSGKTTVTGFLVQQSLALGARVIVFDKDRSNELLVKSNGGNYTRVSPGIKTGWNPFAREDTPENREFVIGWLKLILGGKEPLTLGQEREIESKVAGIFEDKFFDKPSLSYVASVFGSPLDENSLGFRLQNFHGEGRFAYLFDNENDEQAFDHEVNGIDLTHVLEMEPHVREAVGFYLLQSLEQLSLTGTKLLVFWEELWKFLDVPGVFQDSVKDKLKTIRKKNGVIVASTQDADDSAESNIAPVIRNEFASALLFANPKASKQSYTDMFNITDAQFEKIKTMSTSDRNMLIVQEKLAALVDTTFPTEALKFIPMFSTSVNRLKDVADRKITNESLFDVMNAGGLK